MILFDCDRRLVVSSTRYELALVALPRPLVMSLLGRSSTLLDGAVVELPKNGLTPILLAQFETMSRYCTGLDATEAAAAMHATTSLAVAVLSSVARSVHEQNELGEYFFAAARRYIEAHASHHELTAAKIAAAIGCSRAHLYRLFADRSTHVGALLRDIRLTRAHTLIETHARRPVGLIAFDCGYSDLSAFGKAFKRRYGLSPGEYRKEVAPDPSGKRH
ncbi:helix-turn-helix transcriptional regulator [Bradyrhizobium genosp. P]|uniref:helix-turn-helix transcriptional regulator n=1 Tax=Bradyrhizobium genosp. P TaxID=83641 RepID=UPI003CEDD4BA